MVISSWLGFQKISRVTFVAEKKNKRFRVFDVLKFRVLKNLGFLGRGGLLSIRSLRVHHHHHHHLHIIITRAKELVYA